jgi:Glycogen recognition site of AMP-activated protein kinase
VRHSETHDGSFRTRQHCTLRLVLALVLAPPFSGLLLNVAAQRVETTLDAGVTGIRYADSTNTAAATLSPAIRLQSARATLGATGSISELSTNAWTAQGSLDGSVFTSSIATLRGELSGNAGGSAHEDGTQTGQIEAVGRVHRMRANWGIWAGGGVGRAWNGSSSQALVLGDAGAWYRRGPFTALLSATPTAVGDSMRFTDVGFGVHWVLAREEIGATFGARAGRGVVAGGSAWGSIGGVVWLTSRIGIVAGAGTYPPDVAQGFPNGRYASLALRLGNERQRRVRTAGGAPALNGTSPRDSTRASDANPEEFRVESSGDARTFVVRAPGANLVELSGDMTNWKPLPLTPDGDGRWTIMLSVPAGTHQVSLRVDEGQWVAPPGLVVVTDEFGGSSGVWNAP